MGPGTEKEYQLLTVTMKYLPAQGIRVEGDRPN
jgi:hypothetical protein